MARAAARGIETRFWFQCFGGENRRLKPLFILLGSGGAAEAAPFQDRIHLMQNRFKSESVQDRIDSMQSRFKIELIQERIDRGRLERKPPGFALAGQRGGCLHMC